MWGIYVPDEEVAGHNLHVRGTCLHLVLIVASPLYSSKASTGPLVSYIYEMIGVALLRWMTAMAIPKSRPRTYLLYLINNAMPVI